MKPSAHRKICHTYYDGKKMQRNENFWFVLKKQIGILSLETWKFVQTLKLQQPNIPASSFLNMYVKELKVISQDVMSLHWTIIPNKQENELN